MKYQPAGWTRPVISAVLVVLLVGIGARVAWWLLAPLLPLLGAVVVLLVVFSIVLGRRR
jgi:hypothetical protein